ncbi:MAG TPA: potassium/proton antiporter [Candidatus Wallbacteria bacterium]|nr:MAG: K(+)/H(+) antiporter NhaP2 [bacterium ADurb.Bin243]HPG58003.1 potassium/proton antiporter [Candidatus Wallbacteria bacterium]
MNESVLFVISLLLIIGAFSSRLTIRYNVPVLMILIGVGMLVGSDCLNLIYFDNMALTQNIANFGLIFIIFESGFYTKKSSLKESFGPSMTLATLGIIVTAVLLGLFVHWILKFDLLYSLMVGAIISSTDAAAVIMIIRQNPIQKAVSTILEVESAANDPMAILLTVLMIQILTGGSGNFLFFTSQLVWQLLGGIFIGYASSRLARRLLNGLKSDNKGHYYVLFLGVLLFSYSASSIIKTNGIIAMFFFGYWFGNIDFIFKMGISHFVDGLSSFFNMAIFLLLGLLVFPKSMMLLWKEGIIIAALLIFVVRPLTVFACTFPFKLSVKEKIFISWGGIKGVVPVVLATYPALHGLDPEHKVFNIVFFAVLLSCLLQGTTINRLARKLGLIIPQQKKSPFYIQLLTLDKTDLEMIEVHISGESKIAGRQIKDLKFPAHTLITAIIRGKEMISPNGGTVIDKEDVLFILTRKADIDAVNYLMSEGFFPGAACALSV